MRGWVVGFHGYGLKGDDCGLKGDFFLFSCSIGFMLSQRFSDVPICDFKIGSSS